MFYPEDLVEEVRTRNDIVDVISQYVKLTKKGSTYFGLCPFHGEKTASFSVTPGKQMYYCFGCGAGGNVITFIMEYENYTFKEALEYLADRVGMELPKAEATAEEKRQAEIRTQLLEVNKLAAQYFHYQLKMPQGERALSYLTNRGLKPETIIKFGLGYSNQTSDDLYRYLKQKGYSDTLLSQTGLVSLSEKGSYDKFWNRVMFPIMDVNHRVIAFGGRVMGDGEPKYLNSPETKLFDKSRNLYGLHAAKSSRKPYLLLCEGYMDVISLHQAGFTNAVASLGTAFTLQHANLMKRYVNQVVITFDSDGAGRKAALRAIPILKNAGLSVKVLNMKPYKDPDEFIKALGAEAYEERVNEAVNSFLFEIDMLSQEYDRNDPEQKTAFFRAAAKKLLEFTEPLERNNYIEAVSKRFYIDYDQLCKLVNSMGNQIGLAAPKKERIEPGRTRMQEKDDGLKKSQRILLTWLIEEPEIFGKVGKYISAADFTEELYRRVADMVFAELPAGKVNAAGILNHFINDEDEYKEVAVLFNTKLTELPTKEEKEKALTDTVRRVKKNSLDVRSQKVQDMKELQEIVKQQALLGTLHISLD